jgi:hypothetical protein
MMRPKEGSLLHPEAALSPRPFAMTHSTRILLSSVLLVTACRHDARKQKDEIQVAQLPPSTMMPNGKISPVTPERVVEDVKNHGTFQQTMRAMCPRELPDRIEEIRRHPPCEMLEALKFATMTSGTSRGSYVKTFELTSEGRTALGADLQDQGDKYIVAVARPELLTGRRLQFENAPNREDRVAVTFYWRWAPINALGKGLDLGSSVYHRDEHQGRATYDQTADGWTLVELWLDSDTKDYMSNIGTS